MSTRFYPLIVFMLTCLFFVQGYTGTVKLHEKLGGKELQVIQEATFVTMLTLVPEGARDRYSPIQEAHLNQEEIARLKKNLLDDHNYDFDRVKSCRFMPEVSFKFTDEQEESMHVFVSPSCNQILFGLDNRSVILNYDPVHERLEYFVQQLVNEARDRNKEAARW